ncbi:MAG: alpha/beta fold hydrolase [Ilumatobacter sp.]
MTSQRRVDSNGVGIECLVSDSIDDTSRALVVCAHGFPDTAHTWRFLMPALEAAGFRVAAPFLRGYAPSDVPADGCVQTGASAMDLIALHDAFDGDDRAVLVGHDWGASIVYSAAAFAPDRWAKVVALAVPPAGSMGLAFATNTEQLKKSWYMFFFQHPLADLVVPADDLAFIDMIWADWSPGYEAAVDLAHVKDSLREPANLSAAIGYYRATLGGVGVRDEFADVQAAGSLAPPQPLLYLHGRNDGCIGPEVAESARAMVDDTATIEILDGLAHFLHLEDPTAVNNLILEFLA